MKIIGKEYGWSEVNILTNVAKNNGLDMIIDEKKVKEILKHSELIGGCIHFYQNEYFLVMKSTNGYMKIAFEDEVLKKWKSSETGELLYDIFKEHYRFQRRKNIIDELL